MRQNTKSHHFPRVISSACLLVLLISLLIFPFIATGEPLPRATAENAAPPQTPAQTSKTLAVSYINQGPTNWCFHTSLAMALRYLGKTVSPPDVAAFFNHSPDTSMNIIDILFGRVNRYLAAWPDLTAENRSGNFTFADFTQSIDQGIPVIVSTYGMPFTPPGHTVLVIGYYINDGESYIYLHDPSGYLTSRWQKPAAAYAMVPWAQFEQFSHNAWSHFLVYRTVS